VKGKRKKCDRCSEDNSGQPKTAHIHSQHHFIEEPR
jgi:hypothetical protein